MPETRRKIRASLAESKAITRLLQLLNREGNFADPIWTKFRNERIEDLRYITLGDRHAMPPVDSDLSDQIMPWNVRIPKSRLDAGVMAISQDAFNGDAAARDLAFVIREAIAEIAKASQDLRRTDLISRCECGRYLFNRRYCNATHAQRSRRNRKSHRDQEPVA